MKFTLMVALLAVCYSNKWADPSLNTPENNARVLEEVRLGLNKDHDHEGHDHHDHEGHDHHHHGEHDHHHHPDMKSEHVWLRAFGATILISLAPFLILYLIPIDRKNEAQENFLKVLLAFASGGLLGR